METPLRGRSGGHAGTAPTVSFVWIVHGCHRNMFRVDGLCVAHSSATAPLWTRYFLKYP